MIKSQISSDFNKKKSITLLKLLLYILNSSFLIESEEGTYNEKLKKKVHQFHEDVDVPSTSVGAEEFAF